MAVVTAAVAAVNAARANTRRLPKHQVGEDSRLDLDSDQACEGSIGARLRVLC
jgi:hypothetical protein